MSYFMGKEGFVWWQGVVEDRHDPLYLGRCKIRILGWHSENKNDQPTKSLPWAYPVAPITSASQTGVGSTPLGPVEGTWVVGFYRDGEAGQEPMFFGTIGGIPELDAKGVNNDGTDLGGQGFLDPRIDWVNTEIKIGHPLFEDERGTRDLHYNPVADIVPREPATIIHDSNPNPNEEPNYTKLSKEWAAEGTAVRSLIGSAGPNEASAPFTVKLVEQQFRSTFPDTGLPDKRLSATRNLDYLKEPTTNRLARGIRGNTDTSDPRVSGIVFEKMENRKHGQLKIPTSSGASWDEPITPWQAIYPYNHVHQTESGHIVEMDDTPNFERLHWYHRTGTFTEIHPTGMKVDKIINNYYDIILGSRYTHIEANDYTTVDGSQENYILGDRVDKVGGDYSVEVGSGRYNVSNPTGSINLEAGDMIISSSGKLVLKGNNVIIEKKSSRASETTVGDEKKSVGGKYKVNTGSFSMNAQGSLGLQSGGGLAINATDSISEQIFGILPAITLGYAKNTTATAGKIGMEATDNVLSGAIELNLGLKGLGSSITMKPLGDITLNSNLGLKGITASALLGNISMDTLLSSFKLANTGGAEMKGLLGEVVIGTTGKVKVKGLIATLGEILNELIDIITEHTHPTGTGPSGPPMPPASVKLPLLKSLKIGMSLD